MLRKGLKTIFSRTKSIYFAPRFLPKSPVLIHKWFSTDRPTKLNIHINKQFLNATTLSELISIYTKHSRQCNLVNLSVLLKQIGDKSKNSENSAIENLYNSIVKDIVSLMEQQETQETRTLTSLYHQVNRFSFSSNFRVRCNFLLETAGMKIVSQMQQDELSSFLHTLAKNQQKFYFEKILSNLNIPMKDISMRIISTILYDISILDIRVPKFVKEFQEYIISQGTELKPSAHDYGLIFYFCGKNCGLMTDPTFFSTLGNLAKFQVPHCSAIALTNIFHGLSFYEQQMMNKEFYEIFETQILKLLPQLSHQAFSLIIRGYGKFEQGSDLFYEKVIAETINRVQKLDNDAISTILFTLTKMKKISPELIRALNEEIVRRLSNFTTKQFEHIFYAYFNLLKDQLYKADYSIKDALSHYVLKNIERFSIKELGNITNMTSLILNKESQKAISTHVQQSILQSQNKFDIQSLDLKSLCEIAYFVLHQASGEIAEGFVTKIIDLSQVLLQKKLTDQEEVATLYFIRYYGKLLAVLAESKELTEEDKIDRKSLFELMEHWLSEANKGSTKIPDDFRVEELLMNFIIGFYQVLDSPLEETKALFRRALEVNNIEKFDPENLKFLVEKTDLIEEPFRQKISALSAL